MTQRTKFIIYGVAALAGVWVGWKAVHGLQPAFARYRLKRRFSQIEPWTASTNYSVGGWRQLIKTAKAVQAANSSLAGDALGEYLQRYANRPDQLPGEQAKLFLLLRVVFDLPETGSAGPSASFGGPTAKRSDASAGGTANLAWPLSWNQGTPRLVAGCESAASGVYRVKDEFDFLRFHFRRRDLSKVQVDDRGSR
jgi:hypothetical protein